MLTALSMCVALGIDWLIGWPDAVYRRIGHPVTWIGALISRLTRWLNRPVLPRRMTGALTALIVIGVSVVAAIGIVSLLPGGLWGAILTGVLAWPLIAARSLFDHVEAVRHPLTAGDLTEARAQVSRIVGRDPEMLDEAGVARASIESLAENTSDGVIAPLFWGVLLGLPGLVGYKAINTLDSMIGHKTERFLEFGWASARIDDIANLGPARLTGLGFALVSLSGEALRVMGRDARQHRSPNAGWPEASMAGALGIRLSGPRGYGGVWTDEPWVNEDGTDPTPDKLGKALGIYRRSLILTAVGLVALAIV